MTGISAKDVPEGKILGLEQDGKKILLANVGGKYYAIGNRCTHMGCMLDEGTLTGEKLQCVCHGSIFNVTTGAVLKGPAKRPEPSYKAKVEDGRISIIT